MTNHSDIYLLAGPSACAWCWERGPWDITPSAPSPPLPICQQTFSKAVLRNVWACYLPPWPVLFCMQVGWQLQKKNQTTLHFNGAWWPSHKEEEYTSHTSHACAWRASFTSVSRDTASLCHICVMQHLTCPTGKQKQSCKLRLCVPCRAKCLQSSTSCNGWKAFCADVIATAGLAKRERWCAPCAPCCWIISSLSPSGDNIAVFVSVDFSQFYLLVLSAL